MWLAVPPLVEARRRSWPPTSRATWTSSGNDRPPCATSRPGSTSSRGWTSSRPTFVDRIQGDALAFGQRFLGALLHGPAGHRADHLLHGRPAAAAAGDRAAVPDPAAGPQVSHAVNVTIDKVGAYMIGNLVISLDRRRRRPSSRCTLIGRAVRAAAGRLRRDHRPDPADRRHPRGGGLHDRGRRHHRPVARRGAGGDLLRRVPAAGELPHRAAGAAQQRRHVVGRGAARRACSAAACSAWSAR